MFVKDSYFQNPPRWHHGITCLVSARRVLPVPGIVSVAPLLPLLLRPLQVSVQVVLSVRPLAVVTLQVEARVVPAGGVAHVVLGEPVLVLPPLHRLLGAQLGDGEVLLPVVSPVQLSGGRLAGSDRKEAFRKYRSINGAIKGGRFPFYVFRKIFIYKGVLRDNSSLIKTESFIWSMVNIYLVVVVS